MRTGLRRSEGRQARIPALRLAARHCCKQALVRHPLRARPVQACLSRTFAEGDCVTEDGGDVKFMYVIMTGSVTVKARVGTGEVDGAASGDPDQLKRAITGTGGAPDGTPGPAAGSGGGNAEISVDTMHVGDMFGHLSLLFGSQRTQTTVVKSPTAELLMLPRTIFFTIGLDQCLLEGVCVSVMPRAVQPPCLPAVPRRSLAHRSVPLHVLPPGT